MIGIEGNHRIVRSSSDRAIHTVLVLAGLDTGGTEKIVNMLAHHRSNRGDRITVVAVNADDPVSFFSYRNDIDVLALGNPRGPRFLTSIRRLWRLRRALRRLQPDVTLSFLTKINVLTAIASTGLDTCLVLSERNNFLVQKMHPLWHGAFRWAARGTRLVMQTGQAKAALPPSLRAKAVVIPNPVAPPAEAWKSASWRPHFIAAGRLDPQKGFDLLVDAFARILPHVPSASLSIFGEGPDRGTLEAQIGELGLAERVRLPGRVSSPDDWMAAGCVFVLSSRFEGFPNVLIEALSRSAPVVAFDCPWGPADILRDAPGYPLVPAGDIQALADAMVRVSLDASLRRRMADVGPVIAGKYSTATVFARWDALIDDALSERHARVGAGGISRLGGIPGPI